MAPLRSSRRTVSSVIAAALLAAVATACTSGGPRTAAPVANDDAIEARIGEELTLPAPGVLANDEPNDGWLSAVDGEAANVDAVFTTARGNSVSLAADGALTFEAVAYAREDAFTYTLSNGGGTDQATVTARVSGPWVAMPDLPVAVSRPATFVWEGKLYVIGGEDEGDPGRNGYVQVYDPAAGAWELLPDAMPDPVSNACAVVIGDKAYVPGGYPGGGAATTFRVLDLATGTWSVSADDELPEGRYANVCAAVGGKIYLLGGRDPAAVSDGAVWRHDPARPAGDRWEQLTPAPVGFRYAAGVLVGEKVFVLGGSTDDVGDLATVLVYDTAADAWEAYPDLQVGRGGPGAWTDGRYLYVGGGVWSDQVPSVEVYDLQQGDSGEWAFTDELVLERRTFGHAADPGSGVFYAVGGFNDSEGFLVGAEMGLPDPTP